MARFKRHIPFAAAVLIAALLALVNPGLWPYVAAAVAGSLLVQLTPVATRALRPPRWPGSSRRLQVVASGLAAVIALIAAGALLNSGGGQDASPGPSALRDLNLEMPVKYTADARYRARGQESLRLSEQITITRAALDEAARDLLAEARETSREAREDEEQRLGSRPEEDAAELRDRLRTTPGIRQALGLPPGPEAFRLAVPNLETAHRRLSSTLDRQLGEEGWILATDNNRRQVFTRTEAPRELRRSAVFPAERTNELPVGTPNVTDDLIRHPIHGALVLHLALPFDATSVLTLERMPARAIGDTFPSATRARHPSDGSEDIAFKLEEPDVVLEFEVRSPPFRNAVLVKAVDLSAWSGLNWILVLLIAGTNDWMRRLPSRLLAALRRRRSSTGSAGRHA